VLDGSVVAIAGDTLFYLTSSADGSGMRQHIVRRLDIK
jgi:hypothetical protein